MVRITLTEPGCRAHKDAIEDVVIEVGGSTDNDTNDDDDDVDHGNDSSVDNEDRKIINQALRELPDDCAQTPTSTKQTKHSTPMVTETARPELQSTFRDDDTDYLESILRLTYNLYISDILQLPKKITDHVQICLILIELHK